MSVLSPKKRAKGSEGKNPSVERLKSYINQSVAYELRDEIDHDSMKHVKVWIGSRVNKASKRLEQHYRDHYETVASELKAKIEEEASQRVRDAVGSHDRAMPPQAERWLRWFLVGLNDYLDTNRVYPTGAVIPSDRWLVLKKLMDPSSPIERFRFAAITVQSCTELDGSDKIHWCYDSRRASP